MTEEKPGFSSLSEADLAAPEAEAFVASAVPAGANPAGRPREKGERGPLAEVRRLALALAAIRPEDCYQPGESPLRRLAGVFILLELLRQVGDCSLEARLLAARAAGGLLLEFRWERERRGGPEGEELDLLQAVVELGVSRVQAERWKVLAGLSAEAFDELACRLQLKHKELWNVELVRLAGRLKAESGEAMAAPRAGAPAPRPPLEADADFKAAVNAMIQAIKTAEDDGWRATPKDSARRYLEILRHMLAIGETAAPAGLPPRGPGRQP